MITNSKVQYPAWDLVTESLQRVMGVNSAENVLPLRAEESSMSVCGAGKAIADI
jgi:hypothetical protein